MTTSELHKQIDAAFDYRGYVTVHLKSGEAVEGYLFNRQFSNPRLAQDNFVELFLKGGGENRRLSIADIASVALTGEDCAAGKSYDDYLKKKAAGEK